MFRNPEDIPKTQTPVNCLIAENGLGDLLCSLIAVNHILTKAPWVNLLIWVPDYMKDFTKHVLSKDAIIRNFTEAQKKYDENKYGITTKWSSQFTPMRSHPVTYAFAMLADYIPQEHEMNYLKVDSEKIDISKFNVPEKYVILPSASTEKVKAMPIETMNQLIDYIIEKGYTPVFLGKTENPTGIKNMSGRAEVQEYDFSKGLDLTNKTSLLETAAIIEKSKLYIGMDSGLTHLAGFTNIPIICYYSFTKPRALMPIRNNKLGFNVYPVEPDESLGCRGCQTNWTLFFNHDFRKCFYSDYACVSKEHCSFEKFKKVIEENKLL